MAHGFACAAFVYSILAAATICAAAADGCSAPPALDETSLIQVGRIAAQRRVEATARAPQGAAAAPSPLQGKPAPLPPPGPVRRNYSEGCAPDYLACFRNYVQDVDPEFGWVDTGRRVEGTTRLPAGDSEVSIAWTAYILNVTSIRYLEPGMSSLPVWWHPTVVVVPSNLDPAAPHRDWATFIVGSSSMADPRIWDPLLGYPANPLEDFTAAVDLAVRTGAIAVAQLLVPNQPIVMANDPEQAARSEDAWKAFVESEFALERWRIEWVALVPMAKSAIRVMDAVQQFSEQVLPSGRIGRFAVTGCSKRGATSWYVGAVDPRVEALMPCAIMLNGRSGIGHQFQALGQPNLAMSDYVANGVLPGTRRAWISSLATGAWQLEDLAWAEVSNYTMPKLIMTGTGDLFFAPDATNEYFSRLPEPKENLQVANVGHVGAVSMSNYIPGMAAFIRGVMLQQQVPAIRWQIRNGTGDIEVRQVTDHELVSVEVWSTRTCDGRRRDFRNVNRDGLADCLRCGGTPMLAFSDVEPTCSVPPGWTSAPLEEESPGSRTWRASMAPPADGAWAAFYVHFTFAPVEAGSLPYQLTTETSVVPDTYPYPPCFAEDCILDHYVFLNQQ